MKKTIVAFGEVLFDVVGSSQFLGGAPLNAATLAHQLGGDSGMSVRMISRIGNDFLGGRAWQRLEDLGLDLSCLQIDSSGLTRTGTVTVTDGPTGEAYVIHENTAFDEIAVTPQAIEAVRSSDALIFGSLILRSQRNQDTLRTLLKEAPGATRICDINLRNNCFSNSSIEWCLNQAHIIKLNDSEVKELSAMGIVKAETPEQFITKVCSDPSRSIRACIVTQGGGGLTVGTRDEVRRVYGSRLDPLLIKDTIGCGDAVTAALAVRILEGAPIYEAAEYANFAGAYAALQRGGIYTTSRPQLEAFVLEQRCKNLLVERPREIVIPV